MKTLIFITFLFYPNTSIQSHHLPLPLPPLVSPPPPPPHFHMEERVPAVAGSDPYHDTFLANNINNTTIPPIRPNDTSNNSVPPQCSNISHDISNTDSSSFKIQTKTYVVQIPKDRIFNVPPQEHANGNHNEKKSNKGSSNICCTPRCFSYMFGALMLIGVVVGIGIVVAHAIIQPKVPIISIKSLNVKKYDAKSSNSAKIDVTFTAKDDGKMSISPDGNGDATLMYKNIEIGSGKFSGLRVGAGQSKKGSLEIKGIRKEKLPAVVKDSMGDKKGKNNISVWLTMRIPVVLSASGVHSQNKVIDVNCKLSLSSLGADISLTSQKCNAKFS